MFLTFSGTLFRTMLPRKTNNKNEKRVQLCMERNSHAFTQKRCKRTKCMYVASEVTVTHNQVHEQECGLRRTLRITYLAISLSSNLCSLDLQCTFPRTYWEQKQQSFQAFSSNLSGMLCSLARLATGQEHAGYYERTFITHHNLHLRVLSAWCVGGFPSNPAPSKGRSLLHIKVSNIKGTFYGYPRHQLIFCYFFPFLLLFFFFTYLLLFAYRQHLVLSLLLFLKTRFMDGRKHDISTESTRLLLEIVHTSLHHLVTSQLALASPSVCLYVRT